VPSDDFFELMMRNAWHISGGEGWCANTSNKRVLITNADGSQQVVEVKNDLGLRQGDKEGLAARLAAQGVNATGIDVKGSAGDQIKPVAGLAPGGRGAGGLGIAGSAVGSRAGSRGASKQPTPRSANGAPMPSSLARYAAAAAAAAPAETEISHPLLDVLREKLTARGAKGLIGLQRAFRIMDDDGSQALNLPEFKKAMKEVGMAFKRDTDVEVLFRLFDRDRSGSISYDEFLATVRGQLNDRRKALVTLAFRLMDKDGNGVIEPSELIGTYDTSKHPDVVARRKTPEQVRYAPLASCGLFSLCSSVSLSLSLPFSLPLPPTALSLCSSPGAAGVLGRLRRGRRGRRQSHPGGI